MRKRLCWILMIVSVCAGVALFCLGDNCIECCLCNSAPYHAPVLVNLSTGEMLELAVYDADPFRPGELAEEQQTGYFAFVKGAGASGYRDDGKYVKVTIQPSNTRGNNRLFCKRCRTKLSACAGYALVDCIDPANLTVFPIEDCVLELRCYEIIIHDTDGRQEITVKGKTSTASAQSNDRASLFSKEDKTECVRLLKSILFKVKPRPGLTFSALW